MDTKTLGRGISIDSELARLLEGVRKLPPMSPEQMRE